MANAKSDVDSANNEEPKDVGEEVVDIRTELKEALRQAIRGETVPLESLWTDDE